jgi:hypothetical protein
MVVEINGNNPNVQEDKVIINVSEWKSAMNQKLATKNKKVSNPFPQVELIYPENSTMIVIKANWEVTDA